jgi:hypothetical protein
MLVARVPSEAGFEDEGAIYDGWVVGDVIGPI